MEGLGEGQRPVHGMGGEESETQKTNKSFMKLCCKGQVLEENRVKKGLFFFSMRIIKHVSIFCWECSSSAGRLVDMLIATNIY